MMTVIEAQRIKETLLQFLTAESYVTAQLSKVWIGGSTADDLSQQQEYANARARKLAQAVDVDDDELFHALENYEDTALEFQCVRSHFQKIAAHETPLGEEVYARVPSNKLAEVTLDENLHDFAQALGLSKFEAAHLKAFLRKR